MLQCEGKTRAGNRCLRRSTGTHCWFHRARIECSICLENVTTHGCPSCKNRWCTECNEKMGRCPFCRKVYDEAKDRALVREIQEEQSIQVLQEEAPEEFSFPEFIVMTMAHLHEFPYAMIALAFERR